MAAEQMKMCGVSSSGALVPFPLAGRTSLVRRCATELETKHGEDAVRYWRRECRQLADQLLSIGCPEDEVSLQVREFQHEVQAEMVRRHDCGSASEAHNR